MDARAADYGGGLGGDVFVGAGAIFMAKKQPGALTFGFGADLLHDFAHPCGGFGGAD